MKSQESPSGRKISHTMLVPYRPEWKTFFLNESESIIETLGKKCINIEHIGSTSIEGLISKPIIDIVAVIREFEPAENFFEALSTKDYVYHSSSSERHFFTKGDPIQYHLSLTFANIGGFWVRQILFRDYLRHHSEAKLEYANLKRILLKEDSTGLNSYLDGKSNFVEKILKLANWKNGQVYSEYINGIQLS